MNIQTTIETKLQALSPHFLEVKNESHLHNVPPGSESHFKVTIVSPQFDDTPLLARHRLVNEKLADELANSVHALAVHAMTLDEWSDKHQTSTDSPPCLGGSAAEKR